MIAMALACDPRLLIADEPTTALDVTIQAQILDLMRELKDKTGAAIMLITHDLGVVAEMAQRVVVMYAGRKVEEAPVGAAVRAAAPSLHARPARTRFRAWARQRTGAAQAARRDPRHGAVAARGDRRLHLRAALRVCDRALPREYPPLEAKAAGHLRRLLGVGRVSPASVQHERDAHCRHVLLEVRNLTKHYPVRKGVFCARERQGARGRRHQLRDRRGRDARPGRRERLRQVDHRQDDPAG